MTREEAINILKEIIDESWIFSDIEKAPTIDACEMAISALSENEGDLISRKSLLNKINAYVVGSQDKEFICKLIKEMPSVENKGDLISRAEVLKHKEILRDDNRTGHQAVKTKYIRELPSVENKGEWIPVTERLPLLRGLYKISDDVLITNGYEIDMGYLVERTGKIFWHYYGSEYEVGIKDEDNDATAWMPLPEPYKPEKGGE